MKANALLLIMCGAGLAAGGCSSTKTLAVSASSALKPVYGQGNLVLRSQKKNVVEVQVLTPRFSDRTEELPAFLVAVTNGSEDALDFSLENITVYSGRSRVRIYSPEELKRRITTEAQLQTSSAEAAAEAQVAATPINREFSPENYWSPRQGNFSARENERIVKRVRADIQNQASEILFRTGNELNGLESVLHKVAVAPGKQLGGVVKLHAEDIRRGQPLRLVVAVGGEAHEFVFDVGT